MIADDVKALLYDCIDSFEQLGILLLLHRKRGEAWAPAAIARELNLDADAARKALDHLCRRSLLDVRGDGAASLFNYAPGNPGVESAVGGLAEAYEENLLEVMQLMNKNAIERVRTSALTAFADAFLIGGGGNKKDG
jgi:hypothetical protein